jgi:RimJ/RimL family protein N-acetyltransferase
METETQVNSTPNVSALAEPQEIANFRTGETYLLTPAGLALESAPTDIPQIVSICNEPAIYDFLFAVRLQGTPYATADAERFLSWSRRGWEEGAYFVYVLRDASGTVAGAMDIKSNNLASAEIGYWLSSAHSGVMTNAVVQLAQNAHAAGYRQLFAWVRVTNTRSQGVLERAGFTRAERVERNGYWYDRYLFSLGA